MVTQKTPPFQNEAHEAAYLAQQYEKQRELAIRYRQFIDAENDIAAIENKAASLADKSIMRLIYWRDTFEYNERYMRNGLYQLYQFTNKYIREKTGQSSDTVTRTVERLIANDIVPCERDSFMGTFTLKGGKTIDKPVPFWWLGLYPDSIARLIDIGETKPRKVGSHTVYCPFCGKMERPTYSTRKHKRTICSGCGRTLKEDDTLETIDVNGQFTEQKLSSTDYAQKIMDANEQKFIGTKESEEDFED